MPPCRPIGDQSKPYCCLEAFLVSPIDRRIKPSSATTLLTALRANDALWLQVLAGIGIEQLGRDVAAEMESDWMVPLLIEEERVRLLACQLGVSL